MSSGRRSRLRGVGPGKAAILSSLDSRIAAAASESLALALEGVRTAAVEAGLPLAAADSFSRYALAGTAALLESGVESPSLLKDRVASPGGTTIEGLAVLEEGAIRGAMIRAMQRAGVDAEKGQEL